jgi:hypothetical protein
VNLEHWGITGIPEDTFSPKRGEIVRIPAPPLPEHLRAQVNALNGYVIQEFEIGVSGHYTHLFYFRIPLTNIHHFTHSFSLSSSATSGCQDQPVEIWLPCGSHLWSSQVFFILVASIYRANADFQGFEQGDWLVVKVFVGVYKGFQFEMKEGQLVHFNQEVIDILGNAGELIDH